MRKLNNSDLMHAFVHSKDPENYGSNCHYKTEDGIRYVYSWSTKIGALREKEDRSIFLLNSISYSPSTSIHQNYLYRACLNVHPIAYTDYCADKYCSKKDKPDLNEPIDVHIAHAHRKVDGLITKLSNRKLKATKIISEIEWVYNSTLVPLYKFEGKDLNFLSSEIAVKLNNCGRFKVTFKSLEGWFGWRNREEQEANAKRKARREKEFTVALEEWRAGKRKTLPTTEHTYLRLRPKSKLVVTSKGIIISYKEAKELWTQIKGARDTKKGTDVAINSRGLKYQGKVDSDGNLLVGCHHITYDELSLCAEHLGCS